MPKVITADKIEEGMVLFEPVVNNFGQVLMGAGAELNLRIINTLKIWNVLSVVIQTDDEEEEVIFSEETLLLAKNKLMSRMTWEPRNIFEEEIFQMGVFHTAKSNHINHEKH